MLETLELSELKFTKRLHCIFSGNKIDNCNNQSVQLSTLKHLYTNKHCKQNEHWLDSEDRKRIRHLQGEDRKQGDKRNIQLTKVQVNRS